MSSCRLLLLLPLLVACLMTGAFGDVCLNRSASLGDTFENTVGANFCGLFGASCAVTTVFDCNGCGYEESSPVPCGGCTCPDSKPYFNELLGRCEVASSTSTFGFTFRNDLNLPNQVDSRPYRLFRNRTFSSPVTVVGWRVRLYNPRPSSWFLLQVWRSTIGIYSIVGETTITVPSSSGSGFTDMDFNISLADRFVVSTGDFLGLYSPPEFDRPFGHEVEVPATNVMLGAYAYDRSSQVSLLSIFTVEDTLQGLGFNFAAITAPPPTDMCIPVPVPGTIGGSGNNNNQQGGGGEGATSQPPPSSTTSQPPTPQTTTMPPLTTSSYPPLTTTSAPLTTTSLPLTTTSSPLTTTSSPLTTTSSTMPPTTHSSDPSSATTTSTLDTTTFTDGTTTSTPITQQPPAQSTTGTTGLTVQIIGATGNTDAQEKKAFPTTVIAGAAVGGGVLLIAVSLVLVVVAVCMVKRKRASNGERKDSADVYAVPNVFGKKKKDANLNRREYHFYEAPVHVPPKIVHTYATLERPNGVVIANHSEVDISAHYEVDPAFQSKRRVLTSDKTRQGNSTAADVASTAHYEMDTDQVSNIYEPEISPTEVHVYEDANSVQPLQEPAQYEEFISMPHYEGVMCPSSPAQYEECVSQCVPPHYDTAIMGEDVSQY